MGCVPDLDVRVTAPADPKGLCYKLARLGLGDAPIRDLVGLLDSKLGIRTFLVPVPNQNWSIYRKRVSPRRA